MEDRYKVGDILKLWTDGVYEDNGNMYISLSDGVRHTFRVRAFDYQYEWGAHMLPKEMNVFVRDINIMNSLPYLAQVRAEVLANRYPEMGLEHTFKVINIKEDNNTGGEYYILKDNFGIEHRYYPNNDPKRGLGDVFELVVDGIEERRNNSSFLKFSMPEAEVSNLEVEQVYDKDAESRFGREDYNTEFKSTIVFPPGGIEPNIDQQLDSILKTIAGFQNKNGGVIYIGVDDRGNVCGFNDDFQFLNSSEKDSYEYQLNTDGYENKIRMAVKRSLGNISNSEIDFEFDKEDGLFFCKITVHPVSNPIYMNGIRLYQRAGILTQLLKGDEITWFITERVQQRGDIQLKQSTGQITDEDEGVGIISEQKTAVTINYDKEIEVSIPHSYKKPERERWQWMRFYNSGEWSFGTQQEAESDDLVYQLMIPKEHQSHRLFMVYKNGKINAINPNDILNPIRTNGRRRLKDRDRRYSNGWNINDEILTMFTAYKDDLFAVKSITDDGREFIKVHTIEAISVHTGLHLAGNIITNERLDRAKIVWAYHIPKEFHAQALPLVLKDNQTSTELGFNVNAVENGGNIARVLRVIEKVYDVDV